MPAKTSFIRYSDDVETRPAGEDDTIAEIIATMTSESRKVADREGHTVRASHAKANAFLKGELRVLDGLPPELRQGLFAEARTYPVVVRMAQGPGEHLPDSVSTHRGMAIKVLDARGPKIDGHAEDTQDFVLATGPVFPNPDAAKFLGAIKGIEKHAGKDDALKAAVSSVALQLDKVVTAVKGDHSPLLDFFGHTPRHPLTDTYYSQAALRYGDHVAKISAVPVSPGQAALGDAPMDTSGRPDAFRDATAAYFGDEGAEFEIRVQLCTDLETMPVEDASVRWPEDESPYRAVARLVLPRQDALGEARRAYVTERLSFRPAHSLAAHRPLGSLMRARLATYPALAAYRQKQNGAEGIEPTSLDQIPD
ncbi:catalase family protein [Lichenibacterium dinghuense]|uniref:catalase family protein n=1 Tax=Lichenibacterium dinghuense TaxID=2895977 RepID=UPI001F3C6A5F|nr:catalase family protein [Lichenibacterium sp. 6Y81]